MKIDIKKHLMETARIHRDMGDPLTIEDLADLALDIQTKNFEAMSQIEKDGVPAFYVSENMYGEKIHIRTCTHRLGNNDIPVWVKGADNAMKVMRMIDPI